ncbi:MAG TPA: YbgC/FadM family acyl-CoA thioesterase [Bacillota bacterium]
MDPHRVLEDVHGTRLETRIRVRFAETDAQGVVYFGSYFVYFEVARTGLLEAAGTGLDQQGGQFYVVHAACDYRAPLRYGDAARIETVVTGLGRSSLRMRHRLYDERRGFCAEGRDVIAWVGADGRPAPLPDAARQGLERFLERRVLWADGVPRGWRVVVGSRNPSKVNAVRAVMGAVDPSCRVEAGEVDSGVPAQPWGEAETRAGAMNRAHRALAAGGDLGVGMEGGLEERDGRLYVTCWCAVVDAAGRTSSALGAAMPLPDRVASELSAAADGSELAPVIDRLAGREGTGKLHGAIGLLTAGLRDRQHAWEDALSYALAPWLRTDLYTREDRDGREDRA